MVSGTRLKSAWAVVGLACLRLVWAVDYAGAWPVPDTGQTTSYAVGDDGYYSINPRSYTDNGDGTVTDNVTQLMWQQGDDDRMGASNYCEALSLGGYDDWRLPNVQELSFLIDRGIYSPSIDQTAFPNTKNDYYEVSTFAADSTSILWGSWKVSFTTKVDQSVSEAWPMPGCIRCVRGGSNVVDSL